MARFRISNVFNSDSFAFWALSALLIATALTGGSARADVASLIFLRPFTILLLGLGLVTLSRTHIQNHPFLFIMALAILGYIALQLVPLPPAIWRSIPGRDIIVRIDQIAGLGKVWRPLSMTPYATLNAFLATLAPFTALVLGMQLDARACHRLLIVLLGIAGVSALLAVSQVFGPPDGPLYLYAITNDGASVGIFANRNHQALFLALTLVMLAIAGSLWAHRMLVYLAILAMLLVLLLVLTTGSRAGLLCAIFALIAVPFLWIRPVQPLRSNAPKNGRRRFIHLPIFAGLALGLTMLAVWLGRAIAWDRLTATNPEDEIRLAALPTLRDMVAAYFPIGGGSGSFVELYQIHEPDALLSPTYFNHAHNDWLELLLTDGVFALLGFLIAICAFCIRLRSVIASGTYPRNRNEQFQRLGLVMIALFALASTSDYPLRTPFLSCVFVIAVIWACCPQDEKQPSGVAS